MFSNLHSWPRCVVVIVAVLCGASAVSAQSILDANHVVFTPSVDDGVVDANGVAVLTNYSMDIFVAGGTAAVETVNLGKPAPETDGYIHVDFVSLLTTPLTAGVSYEATVSSVGPAGIAASPRTNTFGFPAPCSYSISPSTQMLNAPAATGSFAVSAGSTCQWTAVSQSTWITVTAGASGTGPGTVSYSATANADPSSRTGTILAAGFNDTVTQLAVPPPASPITCSTLSSTQDTVGSWSTSIGIGITGGTGCTWTATSPVSWAVVSSGASGTGPGSVTVSVSRNGGTASRTATITIAGQSFVLTQQGRIRR